MDRIEKLVKEYKSKKLKDIIGEQSSSYCDNFLNYAKDELIKRGESFPLNQRLQDEVSMLDDNELKELVEREYLDYHLEYLEIARHEYLKRGFKNELIEDEYSNTEVLFKKRYPALRVISTVTTLLAWLFAAMTVVVSVSAYYIISKNSSDDAEAIIFAIALVMIGGFIFIVLLAQSESLKVFLDIEENTRRYSDYYQEPEPRHDFPQSEDSEQNVE